METRQIAVIERLQQAQNAQDLEALLACFAPNFQGNHPLHPERGFEGIENARKNLSILEVQLKSILLAIPLNHTFIAVAQEVAELIRQVYPVQTDSINSTETLLTKRELEVLQLMADGHSNTAIAQRLYITMNTVKTHVRNILSKLYVNDRTQAVVLGFRSGLVH